jgi:hypothetical protein
MGTTTVHEGGVTGCALDPIDGDTMDMCEYVHVLCKEKYATRGKERMRCDIEVR